MSDNFYTMELMAREKARWAEMEMQRRQMLARVHANREPRVQGLLHALKDRLQTLGGLNLWPAAGRGKRLPTREDAIG